MPKMLELIQMAQRGDWKHYERRGGAAPAKLPAASGGLSRLLTGPRDVLESPEMGLWY